METPFVLRYRGREVSEADVACVRALIAAGPTVSRTTLSRRVCEAWGWRQANGAPRDMVCRGLLLELERAGAITLPPRHRTPHNPLARRRRPAHIPVDQTPIAGALGELGAIECRQVRRTEDEPLFHALVEEHHYLGYTQPVGEHLKYLLFARGRPIACSAWSSAPRHLGPRDRFIGWSSEARRGNIHLLAYNTRFLILPWVRVPHLASHVLGLLARRISSDWQALYRHPVVYLESFVEPGRYAGTCYRAANWHFLGRTTGRGKADLTHRTNRSLKEVLGYPLIPKFRECLLRPEAIS